GSEFGLEILDAFAVPAGDLLHDPVARRLTRPRVVEDAERHSREQDHAVARLVALLLLALELVRRLREIGHEVLELLLEVLVGDLVGLPLDPALLGHLAIDAAGRDERGEEILAQLRIRHRALDVRLERVRRQRRALRLRHAWYHLSSTRLRSM